MSDVFKLAAAAVIALAYRDRRRTGRPQIRRGRQSLIRRSSSKDASGKWVGWEVDLMDAVCKHLNEKCEIVEVAWDGIIPALTSKQIDLIWSSMSITDRTQENHRLLQHVLRHADHHNWSKGRRSRHLARASEGQDDRNAGLDNAREIRAKVFWRLESERRIRRKTRPTTISRPGASTICRPTAALVSFLQTDQGKACCELKGRVPDDPEILGLGAGAGIRKEDTALKEKINAAIAALDGFRRNCKDH